MLITILNNETHLKYYKSIKPFNVTYAGGGNFTSNSFIYFLLKKSASHSAYNIKGADIDTDGKPDIIATLADPIDNISVYRNASSPNNISFDPKKKLCFIPALWYSFSLSDLDGDGKIDISVPLP